MKTGNTQRAARELLHITMLVMRSVAAEMRRSPLPLAPAQLGTLMRVAAGACTVSELARHQAVSLPTMSRSLDMLVRRTLLERWVDDGDRRHTMVRLTEEGRRVAADVRGRSEQHVARILTGLSTTDRAQVLGALDILERILDKPELRCQPAPRSSNGARRHVAS